MTILLLFLLLHAIEFITIGALLAIILVFVGYIYMVKRVISAYLE